MNKELTVIDSGAISCLDIEALTKRVEDIQNVKKSIMKVGVDYGPIPGCGDKDVLKKEGCEKLLMAFRLTGKHETTFEQYPDGHREYTAITSLFTPDGQCVGNASASCSTKESKYRYNLENVGDVPGEYWELKSKDTKAAQSLIGGVGYFAKKRDKKWVILHRVEISDVADYYNTCRRMCEKRGLIAVTRTVLACSDMFGEEGAGENGYGDQGDNSKTTKPAQSGPKGKSDKKTNGSGEKIATESQAKAIWAMLNKLDPESNDEDKNKQVANILQTDTVIPFADITMKEASIVIGELKKD